MKKLLEVSLGIVTSVGGFLEAGSVATAAQAGADFRYQLAWAVLLGTLCLIFLVEMSGRLALVSKHTVVDAMRERFGIRLVALPVVTILLVTFLVMVAELGGAAFALQLATGVSFRWWGLAVALVAWALLWKGTFGAVEKGASLLGLVTVCFAVAAWKLRPQWPALAASLLPTRPTHDEAHYWFVAVSILGASISPYLFFFYSSGAVEEKWDEGYRLVNKATAVLGMTFGGVLSLSVLLVAAHIFEPRGVTVERYDQLGVLLTPTLGRWGFRLLAASLGIACFGAAVEIALAGAYMVAQTFGWDWSENLRPRDDARFALTYTGILLLAAVPITLGLDPMKVTMISMALTAVVLPLSVLPFLVLMNDEHYLGTHRNGWVGNTVVLGIILLAFVLALVSIPLELVGG